MVKKGGFKLDTRDFNRRMDAYKGSAIRTAYVGVQVLAANNANDAKQKRKWTDRTGQARGSITGSFESDASSVTAGLSIGADHGIFLEKANGGKYAIIWPTILENQRELLEVGRVALRSVGAR